jgi:hypothetical protein
MKARLAALGLVIAAMSAPLIRGPQTYATRGIVRTASPAAIVVARAKQRGEITIELSAATHVDGTIKVGVTVSVRYHEDHGRHVATAVAVERPN